MGALAGVIYPDLFQMTELINPMLKTLNHRGGEVRDVFTHRNIELGVNGQKFYLNKDRSLLVALDGNIFNAQEIKETLQKLGVHFSGDTVSEIIGAAYTHWNKDFIQYLNGDFAITLLDKSKNILLLIRDRIGVKPLYWFHNKNYFLFASELKSLLCTGIVPATPAMNCLSSFLTFGYIAQDFSPIEGVNKLLPAHYLQYHFDGRVSIVNYWSYSSHFHKNLQQNTSDVIGTLNHLLQEAIKIRIPEKKPVGSMVSGGLGSASVCYFLSKFLSPDYLRAYSVDFQGNNEEDLKIAKAVAAQLNISHEFREVRPDIFTENLIECAWHLDEPFSDPNILATWKLAELAGEKCSTVFSGMGSDEIFAGHSRYSVIEREVGPLSRISTASLTYIRQLLIPLFLKLHQKTAFQLLKKSRTKPWQYEFLIQNALFSERELKLASPKLASVFDPEVFLHKFQNLPQIESHVASYLYLDMKTRLPDFFCLPYERITAAQSLNWIPPFLDHHILEYLASLMEPETLQESETAHYLKELMKTVFPPSIVDRPKRTRRFFLNDWMTDPHIRDLFKMIKTGTLVDTGLISKEWLENQIDHLARNREAPRLLWSILNLEIWFRLYINRPIAETAPKMSVKEFLLEC